MSFDGRVVSGIGVLAAVVETGNFARAGEALGLTPSGVSRAVARLEARVGVRLFDRTPRAVTLTDEGRRFHARVAPLLAGLEDAANDAAGSAALVRGRLRVNVDAWFARSMLAPKAAGAARRLSRLVGGADGARHHWRHGGRWDRCRGALRRAGAVLAHHPQADRHPHLHLRLAGLSRPPWRTAAPARSCPPRMPAHPRSAERPAIRLGIPPARRDHRGAGDEPAGDQ